MRLDKPRIAPLKDEEMGEEQKEMLGQRFQQGRVFNIFRTLARAPKAYKRFMVYGGYILSEHNDLPPRERGWMYRDELCRQLKTTVNTLNVNLHRLRGLRGGLSERLGVALRGREDQPARADAPGAPRAA